MIKIQKRDYDLYLTNELMKAIDSLKKKGNSKVYVHDKIDAVRILSMIDELSWDYPEAMFIEVELCRIH
tara:strand:+ start:498 stop:704 length:207 start_codon:yes stop_codon:yes gene_type:complete